MYDIDYIDFEEISRAYSPQIHTKAMNSAIKEATRTINAAAGQNMRKRYNVRKSVTDGAIDRPISRGLITILRWSGRRIPLVDFSPTPLKPRVKRGKYLNARRKGVSVHVLKTGGRKKVKGGFLAFGGRGIYKRAEGAKRNPIVHLNTVSVPQMLDSPTVIREVLQRGSQRLATRYVHHLNRHMRAAR